MYFNVVALPQYKTFTVARSVTVATHYMHIKIRSTRLRRISLSHGLVYDCYSQTVYLEVRAGFENTQDSLAAGDSIK